MMSRLVSSVFIRRFSSWQSAVGSWQKSRLISSFIASLILLAFYLVPNSSKAQFYNGSQQEFGKNRVQYDEPRTWTWYKFEKFDAYFYLNGKELGEFVSRNAEE